MSPRIFFNTIRLRSKNIFFHGAIFAFYVICVITTFVIGIYGFARMAGYDLSGSVSGSKDEDSTDGPTNDSSANDYTSSDDGNQDNLRLLLSMGFNSLLRTATNSTNESLSIMPNISHNGNFTNSSILNGTISGNPGEDIKINFNIFTYTLPFVAFIFDHSTKRLMNLPEKSLYLMFKLIAIVYYLGAYVLAL